MALGITYFLHYTWLIRNYYIGTSSQINKMGVTVCNVKKPLFTVRI